MKRNIKRTTSDKTKSCIYTLRTKQTKLDAFPCVLRPILFDTIIDEILCNECYDMMDEFNRDDICNIAKHNLPYRSKEMQDIFERHQISPLGNTESTCEYSIKTNNTEDGSTLALSNDNETAVSRSTYYIFDPEEELDYEGIKTFLDMLNEAWYELNK